MLGHGPDFRIRERQSAKYLAQRGTEFRIPELKAGLSGGFGQNRGLAPLGWQMQMGFLRRPLRTRMVRSYRERSREF
jgi:hypothetical protein